MSIKDKLLYVAVGAAAAALGALTMRSWSKPQSKKAIVLSAQAPPPIGPYSQAVTSGSTVYVSGCIAMDASGKVVEGDVVVQAKQCLENMKAVLAAAGLSMSSVVKVCEVM